MFRRPAISGAGPAAGSRIQGSLSQVAEDLAGPDQKMSIPLTPFWLPWECMHKKNINSIYINISIIYTSISFNIHQFQFNVHCTSIYQVYQGPTF